MKKYIFGLLFSIFSAVLFGQSGSYLDWAIAYGSYNNEDNLNEIAIDDSGNIYSVGSFKLSGDFDPGSGSATFFGNQYDAFIQKLDSAGNFLWAKSLGGSLNDYANSLCLDNFGNVYFSGSFVDSADFDPGPGIDMHYTIPYSTAFIIKLNQDGDYVWGQHLQSISSFSFGNKIRSDTLGNVYCFGGFRDSIDFDAGPGEYYLESNGNTDVFVQKLDSSGNFLWAKSFGGINQDEINGAELFDSLLVFTGTYRNTVDFDPGFSVFDLNSTYENGYVVKWDWNGDFVWAHAVGDGEGVLGEDLVCDSLGNVYALGTYDETTDFDPGTGVTNLTTNGGKDIYILKLDENGVFQWVIGKGGSSHDASNDIELDSDGNIYTVGSVIGQVDFDPGLGELNLVSNGQRDIYIEKLSNDGEIIWAKLIGGTEHDDANSIDVSASNKIHVSGTFRKEVDFNPNAGELILDAGNFGRKIFLLKLKECQSNVDSDTIIACGPIIWNYAIYYSSGTYNWTGINETGCDSLVTLELTIDSIPTAGVTLTDNVLMADELTASYQWINCDDNLAITGETGQSFTPTTGGNYAVEITNGTCVETSSCYAISILEVEQLTHSSNKQLLKIVDLLGRETTFKSNTPLIYMYDDGTIERVFRMEK